MSDFANFRLHLMTFFGELPLTCAPGYIYRHHPVARRKRLQRRATDKIDHSLDVQEVPRSQWSINSTQVALNNLFLTRLHLRWETLHILRSTRGLINVPSQIVSSKRCSCRRQQHCEHTSERAYASYPPSSMHRSGLCMSHVTMGGGRGSLCHFVRKPPRKIGGESSTACSNTLVIPMHSTLSY